MKPESSGPDRRSDSYRAWLNYRRLEPGEGANALRPAFARYCVDPAARELVVPAAIEELRRGAREIFGANMKPGAGLTAPAVTFRLSGTGNGPDDFWTRGAFSLSHSQSGVLVEAGDESGFLYAVFALLRHVSAGTFLSSAVIAEAPANAIRMLDHWDNADGSVERGYAGASIFFKNNKLLSASRRIDDYCRLAASVGINAIAINNVNVHEVETRLLCAEGIGALERLARTFRRWGIRLFISANFASPISLRELDTSDPLDPRVSSWWKSRIDALYSSIPDFGGFVIKADSEGRPGPHTYGRDHAEGANCIAQHLARHGGILFWRCFVYNHLQDWRDRTTDRAKAAYQNFAPLDGKFLPNVVLQIKNGPMDFQVREPVSPLFMALRRTNFVLELQVTQEYTGQQRHLCFLPSQWSHYLRSDTGLEGKALHQLLGRNGGAKLSGVCAVSNVGSDPNWCGHDLAQANLWGFGRLTWDPTLHPESLAAEWATLTFGRDEGARHVLTRMLCASWEAYESYTTPFGLGWMINPQHHYGPNPDGYEYDRWGTYHFADRIGIGVDRGPSGSGYARQYPPALASVYENITTCPEELLLFFHHVRYDHTMKSGATLVQEMYDAHFRGVEQVEDFVREWQGLEGAIDTPRWKAVAARLAGQLQHAKLWRDIVCTYFYRHSGIEDAKGRTIHH